MIDVSIPVALLAVIFTFVAFSYASVGLGGGSAYTALLAIFGANAAAIPMVSLTLNIIVTTIGAIAFLMNGHARFRLIAPFLITSIPMAYIGGMLHLPKIIFYVILIIALFVASFRIYFPKKARTLKLNNKEKNIIALVCGALLGFVAGVTGIGGGVYLVPLILLIGLGTAKEAAACGAFFIWVNSVSGLLARHQHNALDIGSYLPLVVAVVIGGLGGALLGAGRFHPQTMQKILGSILVVALFLLSKKVVILIGLTDI